VSKKTSTRWYIGAWLVWVIAYAMAFMTGHTTFYHYGFYIQGSSPVGAFAIVLIAISALVMFIAWIGTLIHLGQLHSWGWFALLLVLQLLVLGIVGMVAYALAGPEGTVVVQRPTVT